MTMPVGSEFTLFIEDHIIAGLKPRLLANDRNSAKVWTSRLTRTLHGWNSKVVCRNELK